MNNLNRKEEIISNLETRYDYVIKSFEHVISKSLSRNHEILNTYSEIAYYIFYINSVWELKQIYKEILTYPEKLKSSVELIELNKDIKDNLKKISNFILNQSDFKNILREIKKHCGDVASPFEIRTIPVNELLNSLLNISDNFLFSYSQIDKLLNQIIKISEIGLAPYWNNLSKTKQQSFNEWNTKLYSFMNKLKFEEEFARNSMYFEDFQTINNIYCSLNPIESIVNPDLFVMENMIKKGEEFTDIEKIKQSFVKVHNTLKLGLTEKQTKIAVVERFITYMEFFTNKELFKSSKTKVEKLFQKEFEQFVFFNGYYPISEANLASGRLDTLIVNKRETILFEFKQFGFDKSKRITESKIRKLFNGISQLNFYHRLLTSFPNLVDNINLIVLTKYPIIFEQKSIRVCEEEINFYIIDLSGVPPSRQEPKIINIKNYLEING